MKETRRKSDGGRKAKRRELMGKVCEKKMGKVIRKLD